MLVVVVICTLTAFYLQGHHSSGVNLITAVNNVNKSMKTGSKVLISYNSAISAR